MLFECRARRAAKLEKQTNPRCFLLPVKLSCLSTVLRDSGACLQHVMRLPCSLSGAVPDWMERRRNICRPKLHRRWVRVQAMMLWRWRSLIRPPTKTRDVERKVPSGKENR